MTQEDSRKLLHAVATISRTTSAKPPGDPAILSMLTGNATLMAWLVFLGLGCAFLTSYYAQIHYFPVLDWKESFSYLAAMIILGGGVAVVYSLLLFFPGVIWSEFLIFDSELEGYFCYRGPNGKEPCYSRIGGRLVLPFLVFMAATHLAMLGHYEWHFAVITTTAIVGLGVLAWYSWRMFRKILSKRYEKRTVAREPWLLVKYVLTFDLAALLGATSLLFLYFIFNQDNGASWPLLLLCTILVTLSNLLVAVQCRNEPKRAVVTAVLLALVLLIAGEFTQSPLSKEIMEGFGLGGRGGTLVVTERGAEILRSYGLNPEQRGHAEVIRGASILSRLGSEVLIKSGPLRVTIAKAEVLSWSPDDPR